MKVHTEKHFSIYTGHPEGGCTDIAHVELIGFTLVANADLAKLRQVASCIDDEPIPQHIMEVITLCAHALKGQSTKKAKDALGAIRDLLKGVAM